MEPLPLLIILTAFGMALLIGELLLTAHGVLGIAGLGFFAAALIIVFHQSRWIGLIVFLGLVILSPFVLSWGLHLWTKSPIGRRVILQTTENKIESASLTLGQIGTAATDLRPMGECDFGDDRFEATAETGIIPTGTRVKVVALNSGRPTVRAIQT